MTPDRAQLSANRTTTATSRAVTAASMVTKAARVIVKSVSRAIKSASRAVTMDIKYTVRSQATQRHIGEDVVRGSERSKREGRSASEVTYGAFHSLVQKQPKTLKVWALCEV